MADRNPRRFFVTILAPDARRLREALDLDLDLFAGRSDPTGHRIDGLITLDDVARLVEGGYQVLVTSTDQAKRVHRPVEFEAYRRGLVADARRSRKAR
jgi:hypothetical protein